MQYQSPIKYASTRQAALSMLEKVDPEAYGKTRNFLDGAVTGLSPWITHGYLGTQEAVRLLMQTHSLRFEDKLIFEFAWREFFKHVHGELGDGILTDVGKPVWAGRYQAVLPDDVREARTGIEAIDAGVNLLYETGYLHNHVRMWIASYLVHMRKVHWSVGANWMYSHLLDGDLASNHLSWQWVAGTFSQKPYLFNAENVKKYAAKWDCSKTALDTDYEQLDFIARNKPDVGRERNAVALGVAEPVVGGFHFDKLNNHLKHKTIDMREPVESETVLKLTEKFKKVYLIHPWDLRACFEPASQDELRVGLIDCAFHAAHPWSGKRWAFVLDAMENGCDWVWVVNTSAAAGNALVRAQFSNTEAQFLMRNTLNPGYVLMDQVLPVECIPVDNLLPNPPQFQQSFSRFYKQATQMAGGLEEAVYRNSAKG